MIEYFRQEAAELAGRDETETLRYVMERGRACERLDPARRTAANEIEGCQTESYLVVTVEDGVVWAETDSESDLLRGALQFLAEGLGGRPVERVRSEADESVTHLVERGGLGALFTRHRSDALRNALHETTAAVTEDAHHPRQ